MQNTVPAGEGAMCAVMSMDAEEIEKVTGPIDGVSIANYNCPGQIVITGKKEAVEEAAEKLKEAGARRTVMLNVSGPFHSQMLIPAGEKLAEELDRIRFHELKIPYVTNVSAEKVDIDFEKVDEAAHFIPSGRNVWEGRKERFDLTQLKCYRALRDTKRLERSLGTLGGGNHFIEIDQAKDGTYYLVIHSGSRNLGKQVAEIYQQLAI